jgi:hypothetical protein
MKTFLQLSFRVLIVSSVLIIFMGATVCGQDLKIKENDEEIKSNLKLVSDSRISYGLLCGLFLLSQYI